MIGNAFTARYTVIVRGFNPQSQSIPGHFPGTESISHVQSLLSKPTASHRHFLFAPLRTAANSTGRRHHSSSSGSNSHKSHAIHSKSKPPAHFACFAQRTIQQCIPHSIPDRIRALARSFNRERRHTTGSTEITTKTGSISHR